MTGSATDNQEKTVMALTGHYHFRGMRYRIWRTLADGTRGELVYLQDGYADPKFQQYSIDDSVAPIDVGELVLKPARPTSGNAPERTTAIRFPVRPGHGKE